MKTNKPIDVFETLLIDIYDASLQLKDELPKFAKNTKNAELSATFQKNMREVEAHIDRLEKVIDMMDLKKRDHTCEAMKGFIEEAHTMSSGSEEGPVRDLGLVAYGKKIGHYQIASYEVLANVAEGLGFQEAAQLLKLNLQESRDEEGAVCALGRKEVGPDAMRAAA